jgi:3-hydroxybutyryl-CoA dehydrogenase
MTQADHTLIAVVGGGYMGGGIAQTFAAYGLPTLLVDADQYLSDANVARLHSEAQEFATLGLVSRSWADGVRSNLRAASSLADAVGAASYVAEAVPEHSEVKRAVLEQIADAATPDAIIATNTSAMPIGGLASAITRPERFLGVHWMNPAPFIPGVEVIAGSLTSDAVVSTVKALLRRVGKVPTVVGDAPGFVASRLQYALLLECLRVVEEGIASAGEVDEVVRNSFGFRLPFFGPIASADLAGLDLYVNAFSTMQQAFGDRYAAPQLLVNQVLSGRLGLKTGSGFYMFDEDQGNEVARYRDRSYAALARLRGGLGTLDLHESGSSEAEPMA